MSIFDQFSRRSTEPFDQNEPAFAYLNRTGRSEATRVRKLIDKWLDNYPFNHRDALVSRFRSSIDNQHYSAFFELFLHELVVSQGHVVVDIEPKLAHSSKSPDFLVETDQGDRFYLEAIL